MRHKLEFLPVWLLVRVVGALPRPLARGVCVALARAIYLAHGKLRRVGRRNLDIAFPEMRAGEQRRILRALFTGLGRQLAEFCMFPRYTRETISKIAIYEGLENFTAAQSKGKGVLLLTGHFGAWEVGSFAHSLYGHPLKIVVRDLDNPLVDELVKRYRTLHGNETVDNRQFARSLITAMRANETVGILMDTNMTPPQGVFVDYFGVAAATASGLARLALHTGAAVVPAFTIWDAALRKYRIIFAPAMSLLRSGDPEVDVVSNTAAFTKKLQEYVEKYPEQWLWIHRRWKTRPEGEKKFY